jgi:phosphoribosyl-ATP pyrophosphohydrolase
MTDRNDILQKLEAVIKTRKYGDVEKSYIAKLLGKGRKKITQKVGEEAVELCIAASHHNREEAILESADLIFHMLVLWSDMDIKLEDVLNVLEEREGISGLEEKKARGDVDGL